MLLAPATTLVAPSVMVTAKSACGVSVSLSVTLLLARLVSVVPVGAAPVSVLLRGPVAFGSMVPLSVMLTLWPLGRFSPLYFPTRRSSDLTEGAKFGFNRAAGIVSVRVRLVTVSGPLLVTVIV